MATELNNFRAKYPQYNDVDDMTLANMLAKKFPDSYGDLPGKYTQPGNQDVDKFLADLPQQKPAMQRDLSVAALSPEMAPDVQAGSGLGGGAGEEMLAIGTGAIAEPLAGIAGMAGGVLPGKEGQADQFVKKTREALTFQPRSKESIENLQKVAKVAEPVAKAMKKAETFLGDKTFELTGSATLASLATTAPTLATELIGFGLGKLAVKTTRSAKLSRAQGKIATAIDEATPDTETLKSVARDVYKEIDDAGAVVKQQAVNDLVKKIKVDTRKAGLDKTITPKAARAVETIEEVIDSPLPVTELDRLRKIAKNAVDPANPAESSLAMNIVNNIDDFLDNAGKKNIVAPTGSDAKLIGRKYKIARDLWGRARKSELIDEALENADLAASGFENGIRQEFRRLLRNKKTKKFFNEAERKAIKSVADGSRAANIAKVLGKFGYSKGSVLLPALGTTGGAAVNPMFAAVLPIVGHVSKGLAEKLTMGGARFADQVIRAGKNAEKITEAYLKFTPKAQRSTQELSELLMRQDINLDAMRTGAFFDEAKDLALKNRDIFAAAVAAEAAGSQLNKE